MGSGQTQTGDHVFAIYDDKNDLSATQDFIKQALEKNEICMIIADKILLYFVTDSIRSEIKEKLKISEDDFEENKNIILKHSQDILFPDGRFSTDTESRFWRELTDIATENGKSGLRVFIDSSALIRAGLEQIRITIH